ncbi:hypothetical protein PHET_11022 [Paragonimus heterotremus]|uniref:Uncharacterized protein n=1 Tax=Paragonimus heterotremus TaxID=100268 RepID=A0A8J4SF08_9TREM|nr:hypothetical protein PHET_11022 [Paragonimus heterotremus]
MVKSSSSLANNSIWNPMIRFQILNFMILIKLLYGNRRGHLRPPSPYWPKCCLGTSTIFFVIQTHLTFTGRFAFPFNLDLSVRIVDMCMLNMCWFVSIILLLLVPLAFGSSRPYWRKKYFYTKRFLWILLYFCRINL